MTQFWGVYHRWVGQMIQRMIQKRKPYLTGLLLENSPSICPGRCTHAPVLPQSSGPLGSAPFVHQLQLKYIMNTNMCKEYFYGKFNGKISLVYTSLEKSTPGHAPALASRHPASRLRQLLPIPAPADRKSTRLNSSHDRLSRMPSSA